MYPHERSLVERLQGEPFALIGVNSDPKERVKSAMERENITWRSFWDGGSTGGPIATQYGVRGWPTIYVLDHRGVIRYKGVRGEAMDEAVDTLLAELRDDPHAEVSFPVVGGTPGSGPELREFTDSSGENTIVAMFVKFEGGKAHLELEDGSVVEVSMNQLSEEDQQWIRDELARRRQRDG